MSNCLLFLNMAIYEILLYILFYGAIECGIIYIAIKNHYIGSAILLLPYYLFSRGLKQYFYFFDYVELITITIALIMANLVRLGVGTKIVPGFQLVVKGYSLPGSSKIMITLLQIHIIECILRDFYMGYFYNTITGILLVLALPMELNEPLQKLDLINVNYLQYRPNKDYLLDIKSRWINFYTLWYIIYYFDNFIDSNEIGVIHLATPLIVSMLLFSDIRNWVYARIVTLFIYKLTKPNPILQELRHIDQQWMTDGNKITYGFMLMILAVIYSTYCYYFGKQKMALHEEEENEMLKVKQMKEIEMKEKSQ